MKKKIVLKYIELALTNLNARSALKYNIEGEVNRLMNLYSEDEINEKVKETTFNNK